MFNVLGGRASSWLVGSAAPPPLRLAHLRHGFLYRPAREADDIVVRRHRLVIDEDR